MIDDKHVLVDLTEQNSISTSSILMIVTIIMMFVVIRGLCVHWIHFKVLVSKLVTDIQSKSHKGPGDKK